MRPIDAERFCPPGRPRSMLGQWRARGGANNKSAEQQRQTLRSGATKRIARAYLLGASATMW